MKKILLINSILSSFVTNINGSTQHYLRQQSSLSLISSGLSSLAHAAKHSWKTSSVTERLGIGAAVITTGIFIGHAFSDWRKRKANIKLPKSKVEVSNTLQTNEQELQRFKIKFDKLMTDSEELYEKCDQEILAFRGEHEEIRNQVSELWKKLQRNFIAYP